MRYQFGEFVLDLDTGELQRGKDATPLRRQTLRLLQVLVESAPALLTHDQLLDEVWGRTALSPNALPQAISELRRALSDDADAPRYIDTRRGLGYRFMETVVVLDVAVSAPIALPAPALPPTSEAAVPDLRAPTRRTPWRLAVGVLVALLGLGVLAALRPIDLLSPVEAPASASIGLAIAPFPADPAVPEWVPHAALELISQALQSERLILYRSDTLGVSPQADALRWQHQAQDLLGASHGLSGRWQHTSTGELQLDLSVLNLASGQILASRRLTGGADEIDQIVAQAGELLASSLRVPVAREEATAQAQMSDADRLRYWSALAALARADAGQAAAQLAALHESLGRPAWIEPDLVRALTLSQQGPEAQALLEARLQRGVRLPLGQRLRLQAELAAVQHRPLQAAAAHRALIELYPERVELWIGLVDSELDALQGASARATMAQLEAIPQAQSDPRLNLLRARLAVIDGDYSAAQAAAALALQQARSYDLPAIAIAAGLVHADSLSQQGQVAAAAAFLAQIEQTWSERATNLDRFTLRMRRIRLLRVSGDLSALPDLLAQSSEQASTPIERTQWGIEQGLLQAAQGQHDQAENTLSAFAPVAAAANVPALRISWHDARAVVSLGRNEVDLARREFDAAFALAASAGQRRFSAPLQVNAGMLLARQRRFVEADDLWKRALDVFAQLGDRRGQATCLGNLAASASIQGRPEQSRELNFQALALFRELGVRDAQARTAYNLALDAARFGRSRAAIDLFAEARAAWLEGAQIDLAIRAAVGEAELILLAARPVDALAALEALPATAGSSALSRAALVAMRAQIALAQGQLERARSLHSEALELRKAAGDPAWVALSELDLLRIAWLQGEDATEVHVRAEAMARRFAELKEARDAARAWLLVAEAQLSIGRQTQALSAIERVQQGLEAFADRPLELDVLRVAAWASPVSERGVRLAALRRRAVDEGYLLTAAMIDASMPVAFEVEDPDLTLRVIVPAYAKADQPAS